MILQILFCPVGIIRMLRHRLFYVMSSIIIVVLCTNLLDAYYNPVKSHPAFYLAVFFSAAGILSFAYVTIYMKFEAVFEARPWVKYVEDNADGTTRKCPFTGDEANVECPRCHTWVSQGAFKEKDRLVDFPAGNFFFDPHLLTEVQAKYGHRELTPESERVLALEGNWLMSALTPLCIGCHTHQMLWNALPRLTMTAIMISVLTALLPHTVNEIKEERAARVIMDILTIFYGIAALFLIAEAVTASLKFMHTYEQFEYPGFQSIFFTSSLARKASALSVQGKKLSMLSSGRPSVSGRGSVHASTSRASMSTLGGTVTGVPVAAPPTVVTPKTGGSEKKVSGPATGA
eukprot:jgi/Mesvir1/26422/Mv16112-RA.1